MRLFLFGNVKLKYLLLAFVVLDLVGIASMSNAGGHFAHLGGGFMGWFLVSQLSKGNDMLQPFVNMMDRLTSGKKKKSTRVVHRSSKAKEFVTRARPPRARGLSLIHI